MKEIYDNGQYKILWSGGFIFQVLMNDIAVDKFTAFGINTLDDAIDTAERYVKFNILGEK